MNKTLCLLLSISGFFAITMGGCATSTDSPQVSLTPTVGTPQTSPAPQGKTLVVNNPADSGQGTLRQALLDARAWDTITFDPIVFPPNAPVTIAVTSGLPQITQGNLTIDASDAGVILDGSQLPADSWIAGLEIVSSDGNTIRGFQVTHFTGTGIAVAGDCQNNTIGGDRNLGTGPIGQGNLTNKNDFGIGIWDYASRNAVIGNVVGTDTTGTQDLGNRSSGVWITEGGRENVIGPGNIIANNNRCGIGVEGSESLGNTLTQNNIYENNEVDICLRADGNASLHAPIIEEIDLSSGLVRGTACKSCTVEIFSSSGNEGRYYEGQTEVDSSGVFTFTKGTAVANDIISATATDAAGNTSEFSRPAGRTTPVIELQEGNSLPAYLLLTKPSSELVSDTRLGWGLYSSNIFNDIPNLESILNDYTNLGVKRIDTSMQEIEEPIDWNRDEFKIHTEYDQFIDDLNDNEIAVNYMLHYWDKAGRAAGDELLTPRFMTDEQIQDFLEYIRFVVSHFKDRVEYYTLWSEPDACGGTNVKCITPQDYIELARQAIPVIRQEDPQAKVALAPYVLYFAQDQLFTILRSDVISMFDVIQWHGIYDVTPNSDFYGNYYYEYPTIIEEVKDVASANGFEGEYWGTELTWCSEEFPTCHAPDQPWEIQETDMIAAKYDARSFVMHLGMDLGVGWGGLESTAAPWTYPTVRNLNSIMAGTTPTNLLADIESEATNIVTYGFTLPNGEVLFVLWADGTAVEDDPGVSTTLTFSDLDAQKVVGIDVLHGFEQEISADHENGSLVIRALLVRDYPIILRFTD